jgi:hypothetical protein
MPDQPEVHGLLAMMLLHDARRETRFRGGDLVSLAYQDRSLPLGHGQIGDGRAVLDRALALRGRGPNVVQAIAPLHGDEPRDWPQIAALYGELARLTVSPVVELSRAAAIAEDQGPEAGPRHRRSPRPRERPLPALDACAASVERKRPASPTAARWRWSTTTPSGACSSGASLSCAVGPGSAACRSCGACAAMVRRAAR